MPHIFCIMSGWFLNADIRDALLVHAYLLLKTGRKQTKIRSKNFEGVLHTEFESVTMYGTAGIYFEARLETDKGDLKVSYFVRPEDLAWLEKDEYLGGITEDDPPERFRNPIPDVAQKYRDN